MANLPENDVFDEGVYQIETTDPVMGGANGVSNAPLKNLSNRTRWLKNALSTISLSLADVVLKYAPKLSPNFLGVPTAPTPLLSDDSQKLATTAFVKAVVTAGAVGFTPVEQGGGVGQNNAKIKIGDDGNGISAQSGTTNLGKIATEYNRAVFYRGAVMSSQMDSIVTSGVYAVEYDGESTCLQVYNTDSSAGTVQVETFYHGLMRWRNKTDNNRWTGWRSLWHSGNFNPANYLPIDGGVVTGPLYAPTPNGGDNSTRVANTAWFWASIKDGVKGVIAAAATEMGFQSNFGAYGYVRFPTWLGSFALQWGYMDYGDIIGSIDSRQNFPFTMNFLGVAGAVDTAQAGVTFSYFDPNSSGFTARLKEHTSDNVGGRLRWLAWGN